MKLWTKSINIYNIRQRPSKAEDNNFQPIETKSYKNGYITMYGMKKKMNLLVTDIKKTVIRKEDVTIVYRDHNPFDKDIHWYYRYPWRNEYDKTMEHPIKGKKVGYKSVGWFYLLFDERLDSLKNWISIVWNEGVATKELNKVNFPGQHLFCFSKGECEDLKRDFEYEKDNIYIRDKYYGKLRK